MRILLAEDDPRLLKSLIHIFEVNKYAVDGVGNGADALAYARSGEYDGLVLDIMMPGLDGIEVLKKLRSEGVTTPALFLTARTEVSQRIEGLDAGQMIICQSRFLPPSCWHVSERCFAARITTFPIF